ncbi:DUF6884 domain-containing protein [Knoellia subterranea]|uniref:Uncharacterized protein n=1 Tax=Knoellia subterranea KCTC 19937 TaxID=1385521 RepID=A0A0A0JJF4_9MICO|nr:DUF6884 domain-containing protein [Knoellia subterranea]KGN37505.1 hypothetical protein N803_14150 [Knoellia subterranea KCTC 19937]
MRFTLDGESFELTREQVHLRLQGHAPEPIQQYWVEVEGTRWPPKQVISLATGVADRQRFQSQSARLWLQRLGFTVGGGNGSQEASRPLVRRQSAERVAQKVVDVPTSHVDRPTDVVLIGCVKSKLDQGAAAKDLYISDYFLKMRAYAEASHRPWFILSAEHGLLAPNQWVEPYERYLPDTSREYRIAWAENVVRDLEASEGPLADVVIEVHAGAAYVESITAPLSRRGAVIIDPLQGLQFGKRLSWYSQRATGRGIQAEPDADMLRDVARARPLREILDGKGAGIRAPGMYSWYVDAEGATDLSHGLGQHVEPGLIYAGLAGATRRSGAPSSNTLWGRIATMHLGKKQQFSTLRRSLGSILAHADGVAAIDEIRLTAWMLDHLRVITVPTADADTLDELETVILSELDPPLNLAKVPRTPLRVRLSELRKQYG